MVGSQFHKTVSSRLRDQAKVRADLSPLVKRTLGQRSEESAGKPATVERPNVKPVRHHAVAQVYGRLFGSPKEFCDVKKFDKCPYINQRQNLRKNGSLTNVFLTLLHKAAMYAMLERHPIDSGLLDEEYDDVFGIDLTNFQDIEAALLDGRFEMMYEAVLKERGKTLELEVTGSTGKAGFRIIVYPPL